MNVHFIKNFLFHYLSATFIDVLHSPFVFKLYQTCIKKQQTNVKFIAIEKLRNLLKQNHTSIDFTELGAGSNFIKHKKISIANIAKQHAKPERIAQILYYLSKNNTCKNSIELGTSLGISTAYIALAHKENSQHGATNFTSIEGNKAVILQAEKNLTSIALINEVNLIEGVFDNVLDDVLKKYKQLDFAFIDGNHKQKATLNYFYKILPLAHNNSIFVFDDIYWSEGMTMAWEEIKHHPSVGITVDLFFIGLVFFRKEQTKQHFKLRIL